MENRDYYIIDYGNANDKILVLARSSKEAIHIFFERKSKERESEGKKVPFNPSYLEIKKICAENKLYQ